MTEKFRKRRKMDNPVKKSEYALVTGATGVIGRHFAAEYAKQGFHLLLTGRGQERLSEAASEVLRLSGRSDTDIRCFSCDLADSGSRDSLYEYIRKSGVTVTRAANVAGIDDEGPFESFTADSIRKMLRVNCEAAVEITNELIRLRKEAGSSAPLQIITVASLSAYFRMPLMALYSASKRLLYHFFLALREEMRGTGVTFTLVLPGAVPTRPDIIERIRVQGFFGKKSAVPPETVACKSIKKAGKNKAIYVPGAFNKFLRTLSFIVPAGLVSKIAGAQWRKALSRHQDKGQGK